MKPLLRIANLSAGYSGEDIIRGVSLEINAGDFIGIIGPNGSGKTTLLRLCSKVLRPRKGKIYFDNKDIFAMDLKGFCRKVAFVSQDISTGFSFSVMELALMGRIPHLKRLQFETRKDIEICEKALALTDSLGLKEKIVNELSAGERQRAIISRALAQEPVLLLLDEPTAHLDIGHQIQVMDLLKKLNHQNNLTIIMILHDLNLASAYCNRICLLDNGNIFKEGQAEDVLTYKNIEAVYKTVVLVNTNPVTKRPNVVLVPKEI
ncbi:MAG: ABC transporter ATP-binding protein [Candidatus Omnitrophica bacterium]|nr:ABC transporter ATP-binding protein [Candidatus Omnitrophota bacterium]MDD5661710.1 ABC transporter ATP-binding protein [Candidatus Omnitrophota bacterium]